MALYEGKQGYYASEGMKAYINQKDTGGSCYFMTLSVSVTLN